MCGIFGLVIPKDTNISNYDTVRAVKTLFKRSETRGREASGLLVYNKEGIKVERSPLTASDFMKTHQYKDLMKSFGEQEDSGVVIIGHTRLVTNGSELHSNNNQPVVRKSLIGVHNGIITNADELWQSNDKLDHESELDSEILFAILEEELKSPNANLENILVDLYRDLEGTASFAALDLSHDAILLSTNNGSLYLVQNKKTGILAFASERYILTQFANSVGNIFDFETGSIKAFGVREFASVPIATGELSDQINGAEFTHRAAFGNSNLSSMRFTAADQNFSKHVDRANKLKRCSKCILPETIPLIDFDADGVCNYCRDYEPYQPHGHDALASELEKHRRANSMPDVLLLLSGGRDSSFALHYLVRELSIKPVAMTYDWGMVTDQARCNQARLCGKLGVEHILVSADIREKRKNISRNVKAWLRRPSLKMIPLFMAGDKQYFYYAEQVRKQTGASIIVSGSGNPYEKTHFKTNYTGVKEAEGHIYNMSILKKNKILMSYASEYLRNPHYFNKSLLDTIFAFYAAYAIPHNYIYTYHYIEWDEDTIDRTLSDEYRWETAADAKSTWRIGDGTASFYNYLYYRMAGFSENDTFRANQVRAGILDREQALEFAAQENRPRYDSIREYLALIDLDFHEVMSRVDQIKPIF